MSPCSFSLACVVWVKKKKKEARQENWEREIENTKLEKSDIEDRKAWIDEVRVILEK